jgi:dUTP pyrophosphatase
MLELHEGYNGINTVEELVDFTDNLSYKHLFEIILKEKFSISIDEIIFIDYGDVIPNQLLILPDDFIIKIGEYVNIIVFDNIYVEALSKDSFKHFKEIVELCKFSRLYESGVEDSATSSESKDKEVKTLKINDIQSESYTYKRVPVFEEYDDAIKHISDTIDNIPDDYCKNQVFELYYIQREIPSIKVRYHKELCPELIEMDKNPKGDFIDLRSAENVKMVRGEYKNISLGISVQLPKGYHAEIVPRSSTYRNFGIIMSGSIGIIDESYCGDNDIWHFTAIALKDTEINVNDRICQFRIVKNRDINIEIVDKLYNKDRGGIGSTGKN